MERTEVLDMMSSLKLYGMRSAYDETLVTALKRPGLFAMPLSATACKQKPTSSVAIK